jgi:type I restriction enzyme M protein
MSTNSRTGVEKNMWKEIESICGTDSWDLKQYVLGLLFFRFISENICAYVDNNQAKAGYLAFDYLSFDNTKALKAKKATIEEIGYFILPSELFKNVLSTGKNNERLNEDLSKIFRSIEESSIGTRSETQFKGLFAELDVNSSKLGETVKNRNKKLYDFMSIVGSWDLGQLKNGSINFFGDVFEFLINNFASQAGKTGGNFFTPSEVSDLLVELAIVRNENVARVYDPACGSGSLLLKFVKFFNSEDISFYGQDENLTFFNFCRMNMFLHKVNYENFSIQHGDTLLNPLHLDDFQFNAIVSNPRFSKEWEGDSNSLLINDPRFSPAGVLSPKSKHDMAFIMHSLYSIADEGCIVIAEHPGVMYREGAEQKIRQYLIEKNYIDAVIQLPPKLFFGVEIAPYVLILRKNRSSRDLIFINANLEAKKVGKRNKLFPDNINKIVKAYSQFSEQEEFSKIVNCDELVKNNFSLVISDYFVSNINSEIIDMTQLCAEINSTIDNQNQTRKAIDDLVRVLEDSKYE